MRVSVIIATHGDDVWALRGQECLLALEDAEPHEFICVHRPDATVSAARNLGAAGATGEWLCFVDADDRLGGGYLEAMQAARAHTRVRPLLMPAVQYIDDRDTCVGEPQLPNWDRWPHLNTGVIGTLVQRDLFYAVGGFREFEYAEDYDLWLRCVRAGAHRYPVPEAVYCAHVRAEPGRNLRLPGHTRLAIHQEILEPHLAWLAEQGRAA